MSEAQFIIDNMDVLNLWGKQGYELSDFSDELVCFRKVNGRISYELSENGYIVIQQVAECSTSDGACQNCSCSQEPCCTSAPASTPATG